MLSRNNAYVSVDVHHDGTGRHDNWDFIAEEHGEPKQMNKNNNTVIIIIVVKLFPWKPGKKRRGSHGIIMMIIIIIIIIRVLYFNFCILVVR
jgi:hypothetical protein